MNKKYNEYLREAERREEEEKERTAFLDMDFSKNSKDRGKKHNNGNYEADPAVGSRQGMSFGYCWGCFV